MDKSIEVHLKEIYNLVPRESCNVTWQIGQVVYHLAQIANIQEARISTLEQELKEVK